jgi:ubiquinone/menaquinone biosynthesis C-methylase UbiE
MQKMNKKEQVHICPSELAGGLDNSFRRLLHNPQKILRPFIKEEMTILDVGCGPGFFSVEMAKMLNGTGKLIAADVQEGMLDKIRKKIKGTDLEQRIELHKSDYDNIGVAEKVDFVLAFWMVHEVRNQKKFFEELMSILKPNGLIFIIEPKIHVPQKAFTAMVNMLKESGFTIIESSKVFFSRTIVLTNIDENKK